LLDESGHRFVAAPGTRRGADLLAQLQLAPAPADDVARAHGAVRDNRRNMQKSMNTTDLQAMLAAAVNHPHWDDVAARCLACGNCTQVCPTCFCVGVEDRISLDGSETERVRHWDSCFSAEYSNLHGGAVRDSVRARYRQWLTHKLSTWFDQFGRSGCVGCGRCITFCPAAIDLTEEVEALRAPVSLRTPTKGQSDGD
jgi:ferredoxin